MTDSPSDQTPAPAADRDGGGILVTGASGFIGRQILRELGSAGQAPKALARTARSGPDPSTGNTIYVKGSLGSPGGALSGVKTVLHFAYDIRASGSENIDQFRAFLKAMAGAGVETLVHASSIVVSDGWPHEVVDEDGPTTSPDAAISYRAAKIAMEQLVSRAVASGDIGRAVILRPTLVYGPGGRMWTTDTVARLKRGKVLLPKRPEGLPEKADFGLCHIVHVEDLARIAVQTAATASEGVRCYNLSDPAPPTWEAYYRAHAEVIGTGTIELVGYEDLLTQVPAPAEPSAGVPVAARVSAAARRLIGHERVERFAGMLRSHTATQGDNIPDRHLFDLYASTGRVDVSRAQRELGFNPAKTFAQRINEMSDDLKAL